MWSGLSSRFRGHDVNIQHTYRGKIPTVDLKESLCNHCQNNVNSARQPRELLNKDGGKMRNSPLLSALPWLLSRMLWIFSSPVGWLRSVCWMTENSTLALMFCLLSYNLFACRGREHTPAWWCYGWERVTQGRANTAWHISMRSVYFQETSKPLCEVLEIKNCVPLHMHILCTYIYFLNSASKNLVGIVYNSVYD